MARVSLVSSLLFFLLVSPAAWAQAQCKPGTRSNNGKEPCTQCLPGTYQRNNGQTSCQSAQSGWYAPGYGCKEQLICTPGSYSTGGAGACALCPPGSYCNGQGQTRSQKCPRGRYAPDWGTGQMCLECPRGTFVNIEGATACCQCCSGFYNDQTSQDHCYDCPVRGAYSPPGSTSKSQCRNVVGGGLSSCQMSGGNCPPSDGTSPSGISRREVSSERCPAGHQSCPVYGTSALSKHQGILRGFECVNIAKDLESCGGCVFPNDSEHGQRSEGGGRDCSSIPRVEEVECKKGTCVVTQCESGFVPSADQGSCVPVFDTHHQRVSRHTR